MLILASASPRRIELLKKITTAFRVVPSLYDEALDDSLSPADYSVNCAFQKACEVFKRTTADIVLAADTVVVKNGRIYGKPKSHDHAREMLRSLSDSTHEVITGVCVKTTQAALCEFEKSSVTFTALSEDEIDEYIMSLSPMDKAGAYGIQDAFIASRVKKITGNTDNIMGLPLMLTKKLLNKGSI